jgi:hypothetical protein
MWTESAQLLILPVACNETTSHRCCLNRLHGTAAFQPLPLPAAASNSRNVHARRRMQQTEDEDQPELSCMVPRHCPGKANRPKHVRHVINCKVWYTAKVAYVRFDHQELVYLRKLAGGMRKYNTSILLALI